MPPNEMLAMDLDNGYSRATVFAWVTVNRGLMELDP